MDSSDSIAFGQASFDQASVDQALFDQELFEQALLDQDLFDQLIDQSMFDKEETIDPFHNYFTLNFHSSEKTRLFDEDHPEVNVEVEVESEIESCGTSEKRSLDISDGDETDDSTSTPSTPAQEKKRVKLPEVTVDEKEVPGRDEAFEMWCIEDLRSPKESGVTTETKWKSLEEAQKHFSTLMLPEGQEFFDVPEDTESKCAIVAAIKKAMWTTAYALDGKDVISCHLKNRRDDIFEFHAWKLMELLIQRHKYGQLERFEPVDKVGKEGGAKTFNDRLHDTLYVLTAHKSIVKRIIARPASRVFIDDPMGEGAKVMANRRLNEKRGRQIAQGKRAKISV